MHPSDRRNAQPFGFEAESTASKTIASRAKGGAGEKKIRLEVSQVPLDLDDDVLFMVAEIAIATHNGGDHLPFIGQDLFEESPRPQRPILEADSCVRFLFAPQTAEKRVDIMHHAEWLSHDHLLNSRIYRGPSQRSALNTVLGVFRRQAKLGALPDGPIPGFDL
jgi:hypothetical protein